jgi:tetratricopeptide (TPR) repeat protein
VEFLNAVKTRFENLPEYQYNVGMAYFGLHEYGTRLLRSRGQLSWRLAHFFLGNTYAVRGELQKATREYRKALRLNPRNAAYCFALGKVLGRMDLEPEAIRWLRKALEIKPGDVASEFELGRCSKTWRPTIRTCLPRTMRFRGSIRSCS